MINGGRRKRHREDVPWLKQALFTQCGEGGDTLGEAEPSDVWWAGRASWAHVCGRGSPEQSFPTCLGKDRGDQLP